MQSKTTTRRGRPPIKLDDARRRKSFLRVLEHGGSFENAAAKAGVSRSTAFAYRAEHPEFATAVETAEAIGELALIECVMKAGKADWRAAAFMLERKFWKRWGKRRPDEVTPGQLVSCVSQLVANVMAAVPAVYHDKIQAGVHQVLLSLEGPNRAE